MQAIADQARDRSRCAVTVVAVNAGQASAFDDQRKALQRERRPEAQLGERTHEDAVRPHGEHAALRCVSPGR